MVKNDCFLLGAIFLYLLLANIPVLYSSYSGDDWPNSQIPFWISWRYGDLNPVNILRESLYWINEWIVGQGRFYPLAWIESHFIFSLFRNLVIYKIFQMSILTLSELLFLTYILRLTKSRSLTLLTLLFLTVLVRFRTDFDPHFAYATLIPSALIKVLLANFLILWNRYDTKLFRLRFWIAGGIYFLAMCTYELSFLLFPTLVLTYCVSEVNRSPEKFYQNKSSILRQILKSLISRDFKPILISWLSYFSLVFLILRPNSNPSGAYSLGINLKSIEIFLGQLFVGLPLYKNIQFQFDNSFFILFVIFLCTSAIFLYFQLSLFRKEQTNKIIKSKIKLYNEKRNQKFYLLIALNFIACQATMIAMQPIWFDKLNIFHSYLGVYFTELGTAFIISIFTVRLLRKFI